MALVREKSETRKTRRRYDRLARGYDFLEGPVERFLFSAWRPRLRARVLGPRALEAGVGTGKNLPFYPPGVELTAIDLSPRMLARARRRAQSLGLTADLQEMDVEALSFADDSFDTVVGTFVFCSVPDPVRGLSELWRVCRPGGRLILLEHVRPGNALLGPIFDLVNSVVLRVMGPNINRQTRENILRAGWRLTLEEDLLSDLFVWFEAQA